MIRRGNQHAPAERCRHAVLLRGHEASRLYERSGEALETGFLILQGQGCADQRDTRGPKELFPQRKNPVSLPDGLSASEHRHGRARATTWFQFLARICPRSCPPPALLQGRS